MARTDTTGATVRRLAVVVAAAGVVGCALFLYGLWHTPNYAQSLFGRTGSDSFALKSQLATAVLVLASVQVLLALWMYRRLPGRPAVPRPVPVTHRVVGAALFVLSLPIAVHCILAYGVRLGDPRTAVHSVAGCVFYGAFTAKVLVVRSRRLPSWTLPVAGALLAITIVVLWYTSTLWYYNGFRVPLLS